MSLAESVCGILFLGTPHKGSHLASFMDVLSGVVKSLLPFQANAVVKDLASNSRHLMMLDQELRFKLGRIDIYSFYELRPMVPLKNLVSCFTIDLLTCRKLTSMQVVDMQSALLNLPSELEQIPLDADHRAMCKPADRNDFIYESITKRIISIMNRQISKSRSSISNHFSMIR